ncbi:glutamate--tRNA ligase, cytoplasmic [Tanacetum coccineum]
MLQNMYCHDSPKRVVVMMDLKLLIASDGTAPLSVLAVAGLTAVSLTVEPSLASASQPVLVLTNGTKLSGTNVLRYLGRIATTIPTLYKRDDIESSQGAFAEHCAGLSELTSAYTKKKDSGKPVPSKSNENEMGKVCLRFAPEQSGFLHIGHAKAALMNQYLAQKYNGKVIIHSDDTNPAKESNEFVDSLLIDLMEMAEKLIKEGKAYIDDTPREQMQKERVDGIDSKCRNNTVEENVNLWNEMKAGSQRGLQCCLREKLEMQDPNKSLRDPVYYRCNPIPHHRIGSNEYHDRNAQYFRIQEDMGLRKVHIYEFSRLNLVYTLLSKRKLLWFVENGKVDGWDDARFPTVQGIVRRGLQVEALIQFILEQGASKNLNLMEWDKLWNINKKIIDPVCPRHTAIVDEGRILLTLKDGPDTPFVRMIPKHKKYEGAGEKATTFTKKIWIEQAVAKAIAEKKPPNVEVTLMDWGNAIVEEIKKDSDGNVTELSGKLHLEGSVKATQLKLTWLPEINELAPLTLVEFGYLITKKKLDEDEDFIDVLNPNTKKEIAAVGDANMRNLKRGDILQLERKGYFRCDVPFITPSKPIVLYAIPDGKQTAPPK